MHKLLNTPLKKAFFLIIISISFFIVIPISLVYGAIHEIEEKNKPEKPPKLEYDINTYKGNRDTLYVVTIDEFNDTIRYYAVDKNITRIKPFEYTKNEEIKIQDCYDSHNDNNGSGFIIKSFKESSCKIYDENDNEIVDKNAKKMIKEFIKQYKGMRLMTYKIIRLDYDYYIITEYDSGQDRPNSLIKYQNGNFYRIMYEDEERIIAIRRRNNYTYTHYKD